MLRTVDIAGQVVTQDAFTVTGDLDEVSGLLTELASRLHAIRGAMGTTKALTAPVEIPRSNVLLTAEEAAESLRVSRTVVYALIKNGELRSVKIGSSRRIPVAALDEYVDSLRS